MKTVTLILFCLLPFKVMAKCPVWKPDIRFEIEGESEMITLSWLGGWSSAVYEASIAGDLPLEVPECGYLISKQAVEILNAEFEGKTITAEKASAYIWPRMKQALSGSPNN